MQEEVQGMVVELQMMQIDFKALVTDKKIEEANKLQEELITKHAAYKMKDALFKTAVAEYQEK